MLPILLFLTGMAIQLFLFAQASLVLHQAAFAAARSGLVHKCPPADIPFSMRDLVGLVIDMNCRESPSTWETAARTVLIAASPPANPSGACNPPKALLEIADRALPDSDAKLHLQNRACYAFNAGNSVIDMSWSGSAVERAISGGLPTIKAVVSFKVPITAPIGLFLSDGEDENGRRWRWGRAEIELL